MSIIATNDLAKNYGRIRALKGVSISVEKGEIYGLLGQNGAGKTTLIKVLLGITYGWQGQAAVLGEAAGNVKVRQRIGYLPEDHRFPEYHTAHSLLDYYGQLLSLPRVERQRRIPELLELVGLKDRMHYKIRTYSKGMKQRTGVAQAMLQDPELIFLDEPTDGVDPVGRREIREVMQRLKDRGTTIFLNSHLLGEVEKVCDRVGIMQKGVMIREGTVEDLTRQKGMFTLGLAPGEELPAAELNQMGYQFRKYADLWDIALTEDQGIDPVVDLIRARGLRLRHLVERRQSLEDLFIEAVQEERGRERPRDRRPAEPDENRFTRKETGIQREDR